MLPTCWILICPNWANSGCSLQYSEWRGHFNIKINSGTAPLSFGVYWKIIQTNLSDSELSLADSLSDICKSDNWRTKRAHVAVTGPCRHSFLSFIATVQRMLWRGFCFQYLKCSYVTVDMDEKLRRITAPSVSRECILYKSHLVSHSTFLGKMLELNLLRRLIWPLGSTGSKLALTSYCLRG